MKEIVYRENTADKATLISYFETMRENDEIHAVTDFPPYVDKLLTNATIFEAWSGAELVGFCALYCNREQRDFSFIPQINVSRSRRGVGLGRSLISQAASKSRSLGFGELILMANKSNVRSIRFYLQCGFVAAGETGTQIHFAMNLNERNADYDRV